MVLRKVFLTDSEEAWVLFKVVTSMVLIMGVVVYWSLTTEQFEDLLSDYNQPSTRGPASLVRISDLKEGHLLTKAMMSTIDLSCVDKDGPLKIKSHTNQLRIVGRICREQDAKEPKTTQQNSIFISNTSNGFDATVFHRPERKFTTDYIYLREGMNRIVISNLSPGSETTELLKEVIIEKVTKWVLNEDFSQSPQGD